MNSHRFHLLTLAAALLLPSTLHAQFSQPVRNVENPAQNLFVSYDSNQTDTTANLIMQVAPLPAGKRLAIEALSLSCSLSQQSDILDAYISVWHKRPEEQFAQSRNFRVLLVKQGVGATGRAYWVGSLSGRVFNDYIAPNYTAGIQVWRNIGSAVDKMFRCEYTLHGGLTNLPQ